MGRKEISSSIVQKKSMKLKYLFINYHSRIVVVFPNF